MDIAADLAQGKTPAFAGLQIPTQQQAGFTGAQNQAFDLAQQGIGGYQPFLNNANYYAQKAADPTAYKDFMNPYQDEVIRGIEDQFTKAENQQDMQAVKAGAFGGSRSGIARSELAGERASAVGQAQAQAFNQAQQMAHGS